MLVLFTGGRGSGKTTVAKALHFVLADKNISYVHQGSWRERGVFVKWWFFVYLWRFFNVAIFKVYVARLRRDIKSGRSKGSLYRLYVPLIFSYYLSQLARKKTDVVVYDTDVLTWAADKVIDETFASEEVQNFYIKDVLPKVGKIVVVELDTPIEESVNRWLARDSKNVSTTDIDSWISKRTKWKQARRTVVESVSILPGVTHVMLSGLDEPNINAVKVLEEITKSL